jgi:hypothetical protein
MQNSLDLPSAAWWQKGSRAANAAGFTFFGAKNYAA